MPLPLKKTGVPKKPGQQTLQLQRSVVCFGFCISLQCFWVQFHQPHILACELVHESVFQDHQPPYISFQSSSSFISSPLKIFGFKVLGLRLISWTHPKLLQDQQLTKTLLEVSSEMLVCKGDLLYRIFFFLPWGVFTWKVLTQKQQAHIFQSRLKVTLVSKWRLRDPLGCRPPQICQVLSKSQALLND